MYQKNLNNVSTISKDSLNKRTIQFSSNFKKNDSMNQTPSKA